LARPTPAAESQRIRSVLRDLAPLGFVLGPRVWARPDEATTETVGSLIQTLMSRPALSRGRPRYDRNVASSRTRALEDPRRRQLTASIVCAAKLVAHGDARGVALHKMLDVVGLTPEQLSDATQRVPIHAVLSLWEILLRELDDCSIPIRIAQSTSVEDHDVMGLALLTSSSGADALSRAVRFGRLFTEIGTWRTRSAGREVTVEWLSAVPGGLGARASAECAVSEFVHAMRLLTGRAFSPARVFFAHPPPRDTSAHARFFESAVEFDARATGFSFDPVVLDFVAVRAHPALSTFVLGHAERMLASLPSEASLETRLRASIALELSGGSISLVAVARRHHVSERTLRRQLAAQALSFRDLVDAVRHERALALLVRDSLSLKDIAFLLGFSAPSAFSRAFRRWTGVAPRTSPRGRV
jgi:AraC-like DNA-binding protein